MWCEAPNLCRSAPWSKRRGGPGPSSRPEEFAGRRNGSSTSRSPLKRRAARQRHDGRDLFRAIDEGLHRPRRDHERLHWGRPSRAPDPGPPAGAASGWPAPVPGLPCRSTTARASAPDPALAEPHPFSLVPGRFPPLPNSMDRAGTLASRPDPGHVHDARSRRCTAAPVLLVAHRASSVPGRRTRPFRIPDSETAP